MRKAVTDDEMRERAPWFVRAAPDDDHRATLARLVCVVSSLTPDDHMFLLLLIQLAHADGGYSDDGCGSDSSSPDDSSCCCIAALLGMACIIGLARLPAAPPATPKES